MKIISIIGARPQFIKYAPLSKELRKSHQEVLIHTGQHYDYNMNKVFFDELGIPEPDYNLGVGSGTHAYQTGEMLKGIADKLIKEKPDIVMVYGDTNSTIAGALAAAKLNIKVAHVEAGLRSFDKSMPEEINRLLTDHCSDYLFCPTRTAVDNLKQEGITKGVYLTGDVMVDALNSNKETVERSNILDNLGLASKKYLVVTIHRASNTNVRQNLESIANALIKLGGLGETIVFPVHPRTMKLLQTYGLVNRLKETVTLIEPLGYLEFLKLLNHAKKVLTDSGGIQKEAYILKVPCVTLRENTEWIETVEDGWNILVGTDTEKIIEVARNFKPGHQYSDVFGQGACENIAHIIDKIDKPVVNF
jgi:UDP-N-acetylglucosamine 2-epimerase (non-hydrolysing)